MGTSLCRARSESSMLMTDTSSGTRILRSSASGSVERQSDHCTPEGRCIPPPDSGVCPGNTKLLRFVRVDPHHRESVTVSPASSMALQISQITLSALTVIQLQDCPNLLMSLVNQISHGLVSRVRIIQRYMRYLQLGIIGIEKQKRYLSASSDAGTDPDSDSAIRSLSLHDHSGHIVPFEQILQNTFLPVQRVVCEIDLDRKPAFK